MRIYQIYDAGFVLFGLFEKNTTKYTLVFNHVLYDLLSDKFVYILQRRSILSKVRLYEIFTSVEGEGILYGTKTLFVRLAGCPFTCFYCDTTDALALDSGTEYTIKDATKLIDESLQDHTYKVNFTGGDPLVQHRAVAQLAQHVHSKKENILTYLESSCFDSERFAFVLPHIDIAKIEFKTRDSEFTSTEQQHQKMTEQALLCLKHATSVNDYAEGKNKTATTTYIKIVASSKTAVSEIQDLASKILDVVSGCDGAISGFVIQPVYGKSAPNLALLLEMYDAIRPIYADVRVVPQLHKLIGAP